MSEKQIVPGVDYAPSQYVKYAKPKVNPSGGKNVGILNADTNSATYLSSPLMLTWGVNENDFDGNGKKTYDMSLQFPGEEYTTEATTSFLENMKAFENKLKADALKNSKEWFGKAKMSADVVDALWTPMLRYPKNKETGEPDTTRSPTLRLKIPCWEGEWKCELYDVEQKLLFPNSEDASITPKELISKGTQAAVVMLNGGLWFANGKFGTTWKLFQAVVKPKSTLRGKCHVTLSDDDKKKLVAQKVDEDSDGNETEDSDDDDEDEDEVEAEVKKELEEAPKTVVKKKKVVRRKKKNVDEE